MTYHGGPVMTGTTNLHFIYYGKWDLPTMVVLNSFAEVVGGSPYLKIVESYTHPQPSASVVVGSAVLDPGSQGLGLLSKDTIAKIVTHNIDTGALPLDPHGLYVVAMGTDAANDDIPCGSGGNVCGRHNHVTYAGSDVRWAEIGNPGFCGAASSVCVPSMNTTSSPSGNPHADAMIKILAHELAEALTDPEPSSDSKAWTPEVGDQCEGGSKFGSPTLDPSGFSYNVTIDGRKYLLPQLYSAKTCACALD